MLYTIRNRFQYLDSLIRKRATGTPRELAQKLGLSERTWYKLRDELINDIGVPLAYCSVRKTYYYEQEGELIFQFRRRLDTDSMENLEGGRLYQPDSPASFFDSLAHCTLNAVAFGRLAP
ncbi:hypothetical protein [Spirosoma montaniterrae]|uniref:Helix-turn-helix type 11 domain-containing protein n=1 Tax=Spirosoma montaniterrae TaxID=1178516 RepID=A0A1P9WRU8_9BACT|nr:hypothetical protein [Spirosoma montaniterrae]AQG78102.1 hypothetical protein AWR27_01285 [Spirosoma montaniterrae]